MNILFILKSIVAFFAMFISLNLVGTSAGTSPQATVAENKKFTIAEGAGSNEDLLADSDTSNAHDFSEKVTADGYTLLTGTVSVNANEGFHIYLTATNGELRPTAGTAVDLPYDLYCSTITVAQNGTGTTQFTIKSQFEDGDDMWDPAGSAGAVAMYCAAGASQNCAKNGDGTADSNSEKHAIPVHALIGDQFTCTLKVDTAEVGVASLIENQYDETLTFTFATGHGVSG